MIYFLISCQCLSERDQDELRHRLLLAVIGPEWHLDTIKLSAKSLSQQLIQIVEDSESTWAYGALAVVALANPNRDDSNTPISIIA